MIINSLDEKEQKGTDACYSLMIYKCNDNLKFPISRIF